MKMCEYCNSFPELCNAFEAKAAYFYLMKFHPQINNNDPDKKSKRLRRINFK